MPRKKLELPPNIENTSIDCFAFRAQIGGKPECIALRDVYCLKEDKPCAFRATLHDAEQSKMRAALRLSRVRAY